MLESTSSKKKRKRSVEVVPVSSPLAARRSGRTDIKVGPKCTCDYCGVDITRTLYFRCAECPNFDFCLPCFSVGVEIYPHRSYHPYRVISYIAEFPFCQGWTAEEEENLLDAMLMYGLHNWQLVSEYVRTKSKSKCEQHYHQVYLQSATAPLPSLDFKTTATATFMKDQEEPESAQESKETEQATQEVTPVKVSLDESSILSGFLPKRKDFDVEYDDNAEATIAELQIVEDDTLEERHLKLKLLEIYDIKLQERERKKDAVLRWKMYDANQFKEDLQQLGNEDRKWMELFFNFGQFLSKEELDSFIQFVKQDIAYRSELVRLLSYRANGICDFKQAEEFESQVMRRVEELEQHLERMNHSPLRETSQREDTEKKKTKKSSTPHKVVASSNTDWKPMTITTAMKDHDKLSLMEKAFCSAMHLKPSDYFHFQEMVKKHGESKKNKSNTSVPWIVDWPPQK
ncbi:Transcriptional adapter ADA2b [Galdieria sulphuraria]|uniref:Transcriptional adapter 2-alpha n=1 Tax=Galdieria sulphuraria TaxID=130081 RepID=M2XU63_GALSU|nr:transcriptional adapter 2-alpha [Galdieria sulphuraria]EME26944.1 transcriptional adapter 2-alpha [Galdieria sulphuraria]GJD10588.1 Transcriptional adapter ADA2b [Galdieria sulphuraria]|eukprot:XP_005703464.1 transcriptional adapter 2-alpha [Galdieria sulphuraria]